MNTWKDEVHFEDIMISVGEVIDIINQMKDEGNYHNPTLDELEDRLQ
jgi:hypothetical protein